MISPNRNARPTPQHRFGGQSDRPSLQTDPSIIQDACPHLVSASGVLRNLNRKVFDHSANESGQINRRRGFRGLSLKFRPALRTGLGIQGSLKLLDFIRFSGLRRWFMAKLSLPRFATGLLGVFFAVALGKRGGRTMVFSLGCFQLLPQIQVFSFQLVGDLEIWRGRFESVWQLQDLFCCRKSRINCRNFRFSFCNGTTGSEEEVFSEELA